MSWNLSRYNRNLCKWIELKNDLINWWKWAQQIWWKFSDLKCSCFFFHSKTLLILVALLKFNDTENYATRQIELQYKTLLSIWHFLGSRGENNRWNMKIFFYCMKFIPNLRWFCWRWNCSVAVNRALKAGY